jgi:hypothetical protein
VYEGNKGILFLVFGILSEPSPSLVLALKPLCYSPKGSIRRETEKRPFPRTSFSFSLPRSSPHQGGVAGGKNGYFQIKFILCQNTNKLKFRNFINRQSSLNLHPTIQPSCRRTAHVPDSDPREFGLNSKKQAFSLFEPHNSKFSTVK